MLTVSTPALVGQPECKQPAPVVGSPAHAVSTQLSQPWLAITHSYCQYPVLSVTLRANAWRQVWRPASSRLSYESRDMPHAADTDPVLGAQLLVRLPPYP